MSTTARGVAIRILAVAAVWAASGCASGVATLQDTTQAPGIATPAAAASASAGTFVLGATYHDPNHYMEYQPGDAPLVIIAPHGGTLAPESLPNRTCQGCTSTNDANTQELARLVADAFAARTGKRPHLILNLLQRAKFDGNRDLDEATGGYEGLRSTWERYHAFVDSATAEITRTVGRGLVIDLHGHSHAVRRVELGYAIGAEILRQDDATLAADSVVYRSTIGHVARAARAGEPAVALLNGPNSLGGLLARAGAPAVPSHLDRAPLEGQQYFNGGFNTRRHGAQNGGVIDAIQAETNRIGIRDSAENRQKFADQFAAALAQFLALHYDWK